MTIIWNLRRVFATIQRQVEEILNALATMKQLVELMHTHQHEAISQMKRLEHIMATVKEELAETKASVDATRDRVAAVQQQVTDLQEQLANAGKLSAEDQQAFDDIQTELGDIAKPSDGGTGDGGTGTGPGEGSGDGGTGNPAPTE